MIVNGENFSLSDLGAADSVFDLISYLKLSAARIAVELNGELVDREKYPTVRLAESDTLELIHFVGGG